MAAGTLNFTRSNLQSPALDFAKELRSFGSEMVSNAKAEEALKYQRDREAIQDARITDEYNRTLLDRKASDAANAELAKGRQLYGGVLNTDALTAEANKNSFTPEELTKYDMYKDSQTARAAGETALADKIDWQNNLSNVADKLPGNNAVKESRVQMYEGIMDRLNKQGLPIPPTVIASMDQARLFEETENATKLKENTEAQSKNAADQISNAKYLINSIPGSSGGTQPVTNENGEVVGYTSAAAQKRDLTIDDKYDEAMGKGQTDITKELLTKFKDTEEAPAKIADALYKYKMVLKADPTIDPEAASAAILLGAGVESSWFPSWIVKDKATYSDSTPDALISKLRNTRTPNNLVGNTAGGSAGIGSKESAASDLASRISLQQAGTAQQLKDERAKILKGEDGRREDRVNEILMNAGLLDKPETAKEIALKRTSEDYKGVYNTGQGYSDAKSLRDKIAINETGGIDNPYAKVHPSGALGKYGFVPSTAIEQMKALKYTGTNEELLSKFISTPSLQDTIMDNYMNVNAGILSKSGVPVTDWTIWTSHNLGAGNAIKLAKGKIDDSVLDAISKNLPKGMKPTVENYQAHWFDKVNDGDENKKYTAAETKADEVLKKAEETKLSEEGKTTEDSKVDVTKKDDVFTVKNDTSVTDIEKKLSDIKSKDMSIKNTDKMFTSSNTVSNLFGPGTTAYSSKDRARFSDEIRKYDRNVESFVKDSIPIVNKAILEKQKEVADIESILSSKKEAADSINNYVRTKEFAELSLKDKNTVTSRLGPINKEYSETAVKYRNESQALNKLNSTRESILSYDKNKTASTGAKEALASTDKFAQDPSVLEAMFQVGSTGLKSVPAGRFASKGGDKLLQSIGRKFGFTPGEITATVAGKAPTVVAKKVGTSVVPSGLARTVKESTGHFDRKPLMDAFNETARVVAKESHNPSDISNLRQIAKDFPELAKDIKEWITANGYK